MKILLVDDEKDNLIPLTYNIEKWGYSIITASDGVEAWKLLQNHSDIHMVISDWNMPNMDGMELCKKIRSSNLSRYIYFILLTGRRDESDFIQGMEAGADDFLMHPINSQELKVGIRAGERVLGLEHDLEERNHRLVETIGSLNEAYANIHRSLESAAQLQQSLLPQTPSIIGLARMESLFCPSEILAGDTFNFFRLSERHIGFYLIDVSGHGVPAALLSVALSRILSPEMGGPLKRFRPSEPYYEISSPTSVARECNQRFQGDGSQYFTMAYGILDNQTNELKLTLAGSPLPIHLHEGQAKLLGQGGYPVGLLPDTDYDLIEVKVAPGDRLFLYSDGVVECMNESGEPFLKERLLRYLEQSASVPLHETVKGIQSQLNEWRGGRPFQDDISVLALELSAQSTTQDSKKEAASTEPARSVKGMHYREPHLAQADAFLETGKMKLEIPSRLQDIHRIRSAIARMCFLLELESTESYLIDLCVTEAVNNSIIHAYRGDPGKTVGVSCVLHEDRLVLEISDAGQAMDIEKCLARPEVALDKLEKSQLPEGGFGLKIISKFMDQVRYVSAEGKNTLILTKRIRQSGPSGAVRTGTGSISSR